MPVLKAVNTMMNQPLNEESITNMTGAVQLTVSRIVEPDKFLAIYNDTINDQYHK